MNEPMEGRPSVVAGSEPQSTGAGRIPWLPITNIVLLILIILFLLLISMRIALCPGGSSKSEDSQFYIEIGKISQRTADTQAALETTRQSDAQNFQSLQAKIDECTNSIKDLSTRVEKLSKQLSKMKKGDKTEALSQQLHDINGSIAALNPTLTKLQANSSKKAIGLINIDTSH